MRSLTDGMKWAIVGTLCFIAFIASCVLLSQVGEPLNPKERYQRDYSDCVIRQYVNHKEVDNCNKINPKNYE